MGGRHSGNHFVIGTKMTLLGSYFETHQTPVFPAEAGIHAVPRDNTSIEIGDLPKANVVRGLVPRWGRVGAWQNPPCQFAEPTHNSNFSYLGVQAQAGMSDWYENDVTRLR